MHPWLIHSWGVTTYGACIVAGLILAWLLARWNARRMALDASRIDLLVPVVVAAGLLGAYAFGWLSDDAVQAAGGDQAHGTVLFGSLLIATSAGIAYALAARITLGRLGDVAAAPIALGIACGRIGCFYAGCCYGKVCAGSGMAWMGVHFPKGSFAWQDQAARHLIAASSAASLLVYPVQLYESGLCLALAVLLVAGLRPVAIPDEGFLTLGIGYGIIRFALEFWRADNPPVALHLTFSQWISAAVVLIATGTLLARRQWAGTLGLLVKPPALRA